jgi:hypothetical protein
MTQNLSFSEALVALKTGKKVARSGWDGKDQYVVAQAITTTTPSTSIWNTHNKAHAEKLNKIVKRALRKLIRRDLGRKVTKKKSNHMRHTKQNYFLILYNYVR